MADHYGLQKCSVVAWDDFCGSFSSVSASFRDAEINVRPAIHDCDPGGQQWMSFRRYGRAIRHQKEHC